MSWMDNVSSTPRKGGTEVFEATTLQEPQLKQLAQYFGTNVTQDEDGNYLALPPNLNMDGKSLSQFVDFWLSASTIRQRDEKERAERYASYEAMDRIMGEAILTLNTYADEALGIGFVEEPIDIKIEGADAQINDLYKILHASDILTRARSQIRTLCKFGDLGYLLIMPSGDKSTDPSEIRVEAVAPNQWDAIYITQSKVPIGYKPKRPKDDRVKAFARRKSSDNFNRRKKNTKQYLQPWEFIQSTVPDDELKPYGRSLLEAMRVAFDQLVTIEALLALSRASRVERLVIKIPTATNNPVAAVAKLNHLKSQYKSLIMSNGSGGKESAGRIPSLQDVMFIPSDDGFGIDNIKSNIDISSTDDAEYFRDKALMLTGLPKGYFLADDTTDRGQALASQDLKFARMLAPYQDSYAYGLVKLIVALLGYLGADLSQVKVSVNIKRPVQVSEKLLQTYEAVSNTASRLIENYRSAKQGGDRDKKIDVPEGVYDKLTRYLGMDETIASMFDDGKNRPSGKDEEAEVNPMLSHVASSYSLAELKLSEPDWVNIFASTGSDGDVALKECLEDPSKFPNVYYS